MLLFTDKACELSKLVYLKLNALRFWQLVKCQSRDMHLVYSALWSLLALRVWPYGNFVSLTVFFGLLDSALNKSSKHFSSTALKPGWNGSSYIIYSVEKSSWIWTAIIWRKGYWENQCIKYLLKFDLNQLFTELAVVVLYVCLMNLH